MSVMQDKVARWATWARSMAARHERFTARQGRLVMTLLEPLRMSVSINRRYESFAVAVFPRIQVSIGGILNELGSRTSENKTVTRMTRIEERFGFGFGATHDQFTLEKQIGNHHTSEITTHQRREVLGHTHAIRINPRVTQSPVLRVFARFEQRDPGVMLQKLLYENESQKVIERVSREHLRVEQRTRGDMVIKTQPKPAAVVEDRRRELETQFASTSKTRGPSWPEKPPEINVEQLTEQVIRRIDHRITAYRERLGRAF
jgi:hypothetical protein